jgi:hypothetical protein
MISYPCTSLDMLPGLQKVEILRIFRQSARECGKVVSPKHRPPLPPILDNYCYTHRISNTYYFSTATMVSRTRLYVMLYAQFFPLPHIWTLGLGRSTYIHTNHVQNMCCEGKTNDTLLVNGQKDAESK